MISLLNYSQHPTNRLYTVFGHKQKEQSDFFEKLLNDNHINYEKDIEEDNGRITIYFAVSNSHLKIAKKLNFEAIGHFRQPFIADAIIRYFIIGISIVVISLAIAGYVLQGN